MKTVQYPKGNRSVSNFNQVAHTLSLFVRHHAPHRPLYDHPTPTCSGRDAQANGWQFKSLVTDPCCSGSNETADTITSIKYSADTWLLMAHTEHIHMHTYAHTHTHTQAIPNICNRFSPWVRAQCSTVKSSEPAESSSADDVCILWIVRIWIWAFPRLYGGNDAHQSHMTWGPFCT